MNQYHRVSKAGEAWKPYLQKERLSWCHPEDINGAFFDRFARSEWISKIIRYTDITPAGNVRVLEAGCGAALFGVTLARMGCSVDAFDYNEEALRFAEQIKRVGLVDGRAGRLDLRQGNLLSIAAPSDRYDLVINQCVIEYFVEPEERQAALGEMFRVCKPGGRTAVIVQNLKCPFRWWWSLTKYPGYTDGPPMYAYGARALAGELRRAGFAEVITDGIYPWHSLFLWPKWYKKIRLLDHLVYYASRGLDLYAPLPSPLRRTFSSHILAVGRKP